MAADKTKMSEKSRALYEQRIKELEERIANNTAKRGDKSEIKVFKRLLRAFKEEG